MLGRVIEGYDFNHALSVLVPVLGGAAFNTAIGIGRQTKIAAFLNRVSRDLLEQLCKMNLTKLNNFLLSRATWPKYSLLVKRLSLY